MAIDYATMVGTHIDVDAAEELLAIIDTHPSPMPVDALREYIADLREQAKKLRNEIPNLRDGTDKRFDSARDADLVADELTAIIAAASAQGEVVVSAHTPGPWAFAPGNDEDGNAAKITTVAWCSDYVIGLHSDIPGGNYRDGDPSGDPEADARLIAAAPELLAALSDAAEHLDAIRTGDDEEVAAWALADKCRAVIAKATGATP